MNFISVDGKKLYAGGSEILLRGFGLGGWLLPEGYMWQLYTKCDRPRRMEEMIETLCGKEYADSFWNRYLNTYITEADICRIAGEGFNCVRLPLNARHLYKYQNGRRTFIPDMLERVDDLIRWCRKYGVYVVLDMHAAPGGQTGQNIDDSEDDLPRLFMDRNNEDELCILWHAIAERYADEPAVAGFDLMNEPLPNCFAQYNTLVLPLYDKLIKIIREVDEKHIIILEGVHWATDFSIFDPLKKGELDNIVLQFHKYWNTPDAESLAPYLSCADRLQVPLMMGEGGENNLAWYTTVFPLYERREISWSFWSYKKMGKSNSPVSFARPSGWDSLIAWLDGGEKPSRDAAKRIFDDFLYAVAHARINEDVTRALKREVPLSLPCEAYDGYAVSRNRRTGAELRLSEPVTLLFANGKTGIPDYRRYDGEPQPQEENIIAELISGETLAYRFLLPCAGTLFAFALFSGAGEILLKVDDEDMKQTGDNTFSMDGIPAGEHTLLLTCTGGCILADTIRLSM
ncbi:MAG: cellulase family glycosylhydrolase [Eubacteriales bacterium]